MKWQNVYVLVLQVHQHGTSQFGIIQDSAKAYVKLYSVPNERTFTSNPGDPDFNQVGKGSLSNVGLNDKLIVIAHGNKDQVGSYKSPSDLAAALSGWGLTAVGLITFKACEIGAGEFLGQLRNVCLGRGVNIGWLKGYRSSTSTMPRFLFFGKPMEVTESDYMLMKGRETDRLRIIRGNAEIRPPSKRYASVDESDIRLDV